MSDLHEYHFLVSPEDRSRMKRQSPALIWFTGLSGSGKSTVANKLEKALYDSGFHTYLLDGDSIRKGLNKDLGFTDADRTENIRRIAETSRLMIDAGLIVIAAFISPFESDREMVKDIIGRERTIEIFMDTPIEECERRDVKGLYAKARRGELRNFTGIDSPYEQPVHADLSIRTLSISPDEAVQQIISLLKTREFIV